MSSAILKTVLVLVVAGALALLLRGTVVEDDLVRSLDHPDPVVRSLFDRYQEKSPFRGKIYVETGGLAAAQRERLAAVLGEAGYREVGLFDPPTASMVLALATQIPASDLDRLLDEGAVRRRADEVLSLAMLPGGGAALRELEADPMGLGPALLARLAALGGAPGAPAGGALRVYQSPVPLDYAKVERVYRMLAELSPRANFIGGDFFSLENYQAVVRDIVVCSALSLVLNLAVFFLFTGRWVLLGLLFLGSVVSYLTGLLAIRAFYPQVYAVVLAYTSTFVGFNNESLVHLAGVEAERRRQSLLGIWSAIGTTFIGFLVLLLGRSVLVRQMALASLGGMAGFLLFLVPYRAMLRGARFRGMDWPKLTVSPWVPAALCAVCVAGVAALGVPHIETRIERFRYQTPLLEAQVAHFSRRLDALSLENVVAVPVEGSASGALETLAERGLVDPGRHPLALFRPAAEQERSLQALREAYPHAVARLRRILAEAGVRVEVEPALPASVGVRTDWEFLDLIGDIGPVRWTDAVGSRRFFFAGLRPGRSASAEGVVALSPRHYYGSLLTAFSRELGWLFLAGLAAMAVYLAALQRSLSRVVYVFTPLFLSALAFAAYTRATGETINIAHIMGFSLVMALALDYTAVAVSTDHGKVELAKVLLTGLSSVATFGILILARHQVLRDLGATVVVGCGVSLLFALFVRLPGSAERGPA